MPAYFDEVRRKATQDAGYIAGLEVIDIINEPTAAAIAFGYEQGILRDSPSRARPSRILVYDLGGGTFDVTIMEICGTDFVTLATDGDVLLGGQDWDGRLVDLVAEEFIRTHQLDPREDANTLGRLWRDCEDAKRTLSARQKVAIPCDYQGQAIRVDVTRDRFAEITRDLLDRTAFTTRQTLQAAGLDWRQIDRVLLVGGSTRMPAVIEMLTTTVGQGPRCVDRSRRGRGVRRRTACRPIDVAAPRRVATVLGQERQFAQPGRRRHGADHPSPPECHHHSTEHAAARHRQADLSHSEGEPRLGARPDRGGRECGGRRMRANRSLHRA